MPDLSALESRIRALEQQTSDHKGQLRGHKEWRDNLLGDGNIRHENGKIVLGLRADGFHPSTSTSAPVGTISDVIIVFAGTAYYCDLNGTVTGPV